MMPWVKLDDAFFRNPKVMTAGRDGRDLYLVGLCYASSQLTDGFIPASALRVLAAEAEIDNRDEAVQRLVSCGLWLACEGGFRIKDYLQYNPSAEQVKAKRGATAKRVADWRAKNPDARKTGNTVGNGVTSGVGNAVGTSSPVPNPNPHRNISGENARARDDDPFYVALSKALKDTATTRLTQSALDERDACVDQLRSAGYQPAELAPLADEFRRRYPRISLTAKALAHHAPELSKPRASPPVERNGHGKQTQTDALREFMAGDVEVHDGRDDAEAGHGAPVYDVAPASRSPGGQANALRALPRGAVRPG